MLTCPRCGRENPEDFRFCGACAAPLQSETAERREERKVVTVLFCDLVGSTAQAERMDPEDVRALLSRYHERVRTELELFGGTVEKFIGDAVMALFGAPVAHEDDPERAVRAALAIQEAVAAEAGSQLRIGIATGEALVALGARPAEGEGMAAGDVVNTAARLQTAAPAGGILVEEATYRATERAIAFTSLPAVEAKGKAAPIPVWRADQAKARLGSDSGGVVRTQLVGRDDELAALVAALNRAIREREPQLATLVGVPGIGKSRLVYELLQHVDSEPQPVCWRQGRSLPYGEGMPMWALAEIVKSHAGILESDSAEVVAEKLASAVAHVFDEDPEWIESHLGPVVGVGSDADASGDRRDESFAAWRRFLEGIAETSPLVLVFEDLHWSHDHLLDFVEHLAEWATGVPMLILGTSRPELLSRRPDWGGGTSNALTLRLSALTDEDTARLVHGLLARSVLPAGVQAVLLERAAGNPLYAEEFVRVVVERGAAVADELPESIQGIIAARLDAAAADEKAVLQDAAVVGKVFWEGAVAAIGAEDRPLDALLHALVRKDFVRRERRSAVAGEVEYSFRHALVRDVAYGQIPRVDRIEKHRRAAGWIETLGRPDDHAEMMAHHYMAALELAEASGQDTAELDERARIVLRRSGDRALALNAFPDAARFYRQALEMWPQDDPARADLLFACGTALRWADGTGDDLIAEAASAFITRADLDAVAAAEILLSDIDVERGDFAGAQERLRTVARRLADQPRSRGRASVLAHIARLHLLRSDLPEAERIGREAAAMAQELGAEDIHCHALNTAGCARAQLGDAEGVREIEQSIQLARELNSAPLLLRGYNNLSAALGWLGETTRERQAHEEGLRVAERFGQTRAAGILRGNLPWAFWRTGDWEVALRLANGFVAEVEAGEPSMLEQRWREIRLRIWFARGLTDDALAEISELIRAIRESEYQGETFAIAGRVFQALGRMSEAHELADEILELGRERPATLTVPDAAVLMTELGRADEFLSSLGAAPKTRWRELAVQIAEGRYEEAAEVFGELGDTSFAADMWLLAGARLHREDRLAEAVDPLERALGFYRSVGATRYVADAERLLADATAATPGRAEQSR